MEYITKIVKLATATPLPCSIYNPLTDKPCGKDAFAAYAYPLEGQGPIMGRWVLQPVCRECATKAEAVYK